MASDKIGKEYEGKLLNCLVFIWVILKKKNENENAVEFRYGEIWLP